jgi:hypothetical protein
MQDTDDMLISSLSTTEGGGCNTPTHTSMPPEDDSELPSYSGLNLVGVCPWKYTTYTIRKLQGIIIIVGKNW